MRWYGLLLGVLLMWELAGCQYYQEYRQIKGNADITEERAALLKAYRHCMQTYEKTPAQAKERCAGYAQPLQTLEGSPPPAKE